MDKVLILDGDGKHVHSLQSGLNKMRQFEVEAITSGEKAIELLESKKISIFVTEVFLPDMDALDLLSFMTLKRPNVPCIIMTDHGKPWYKKQMAQQSFLYHLEKPFTIDVLVSAIMVGLNLRDEGNSFKGMTTASLLPLVEILQRTCRMEIASKEKGKGYFYFKDGSLIDAHFNKLSGDAAAQEIVQWDRILFKIDELPRFRTRTRVKTQLMDLVGASWDQKRDKGINAILLTREYLSSICSKFIESFKKIKGYQALAVIGDHGEILASDKKGEKIDMDRLAGDLGKFFYNVDKTYDYINIGKGKALTLHQQDNVIIILNPPKKTYPRVRLIGVSSAKGNWFYLKTNLEKLLEEIVAI